MSQILFSAATWLHAIATIIFIGHYLLLVLIYLPVLAKENGGGIILSVISKRSRVWSVCITDRLCDHWHLPHDGRYKLSRSREFRKSVGHPDARQTYPDPWHDRHGILVQRHPARRANDEFE